MKYQDLQNTLTEAGQLLADNKRVVTPAMVALIEQAIGFFDGSSHRLMNDAESSQVAEALKAFVIHERTLQAGLADTLIASIAKIQARPMEVAAIAVFL